MASIWKNETEKKIIELSEKALLSQGLRPVDVDCRMGPRSLLRLFIEKKSGEVSLEDCKSASETLSPLVEESLFHGPFDLEVSSPGLDARLRTQEDFKKYIGDEVKLVFTESIESLGGKARGHLLKVDEEGVVIQVAGKPETKVLFQNIKQANRVWEAK